MRALAILILSLLLTLTAFGQQSSVADNNGFTNKTEAKVDTTDFNEPDGKWIMYLESDGEFAGGDTTAPFYSLTVIKGGKPFGIEREFYKSGKRRKVIPYSLGDRNGIEKGYYENGVLWYVMNWANGKINGVRKTYYESGDLQSEIPYKDGKANGITKTYDKNGKLENAIPYTNGVEDNTIKVDANGNEIK